MAFEEPHVIQVFDRSYGDRKEELRFERGSYNGRDTFSLRLYWQGNDGKWRWAEQKPSQSGKCWQSLNLKAHELRELGEALIAEAGGKTASAPQQQRAQPKREYKGSTGQPSAAEHSDDIPF